MNANVSRVKWITALPCVIAATLAGAAPARANDADCKALSAQLQRLEEQIRVLDAKLSALEQSRPAAAAAAVPTPSASAPAPAATTSEVAAQAAAQLRREDEAVREGWKQVKSGMTQDQIKGLLGAPQQTFTLSGKPVWYYYYPAVGGGSVMYDATGHVIGHQTPPFSAFGLY